jgi:hypothetical protein
MERNDYTINTMAGIDHMNNSQIEMETLNANPSTKPLNKGAKKFVHNELGLVDLVANIKFAFWKFIFGTLGRMKQPELDEKVMSFLSQT